MDYYAKDRESRPTRARGLKLLIDESDPDMLASRPTRARGLKLQPLRQLLRKHHVAPHAGAWIETCLKLAIS